MNLPHYVFNCRVLRHQMRERHLHQTDIADKLDVSPSAVCRWVWANDYIGRTPRSHNLVGLIELGFNVLTGDGLRYIRENVFKYTKKDMAEALNISPATYSRREQGYGQFTTDQLGILSDMLYEYA